MSSLQKRLLDGCEYTPPDFASHLPWAPRFMLPLSNTPTPILPWSSVPGLPEGCPLFIKRDDFTGSEWSGNKARKLNFLLAEAIATDCDCVIAIGGRQSNCCRATTAACRHLGLEPFVITREDSTSKNGNYLVNMLLGAQMTHVTRSEIDEKGADFFIDREVARLKADGRRPYVIPLGGSNALGTWGHIEMVRELAAQLTAKKAPVISDLVVPSGSAGTITGIALGCHLAHKAGALPKINSRGYFVCFTTEWHYNMADTLLADLYRAPSAAVPQKPAAPPRATDLLHFQYARGIGYAKATSEELQFMWNVARSTGVILDPSYTNKTVLYMVKQLQSKQLSPSAGVLYVHTGGLSNVYDREEEIENALFTSNAA